MPARELGHLIDITREQRLYTRTYWRCQRYSAYLNQEVGKGLPGTHEQGYIALWSI